MDYDFIISTIQMICTQHKNGYYLSEDDLQKLDTVISDLHAIYDDVIK
jgi:hypothetical protein